MFYLVLLPGLLCGAAVSVTDVRSRRVPRSWVAGGYVAQLAALVAWAVAANELFTVLTAVVISLGAAVLQLLLGLVRPGSLGFGDVTITLVIGLAVGAAGWTATLLWWVAMGVIGLGAIGVGTRLGHADVPFAPVIVVSGAVGVALSAMLV